MRLRIGISALFLITCVVSSSKPPPGHRCLDWNFGGWSPILYQFQNGQLNRLVPAATSQALHVRPQQHIYSAIQTQAARTPLLLKSAASHPPTYTQSLPISRPLSSSSPTTTSTATNQWTPYYGGQSSPAFTYTETISTVASSAPQYLSPMPVKHRPGPHVFRYTIRNPSKQKQSSNLLHTKASYIPTNLQTVPPPPSFIPHYGHPQPASQLLFKPYKMMSSYQLIPSTGYAPGYPIKPASVKYMYIGRPARLPHTPMVPVQQELYTNTPQPVHQPKLVYAAEQAEVKYAPEAIHYSIQQVPIPIPAYGKRLKSSFVHLPVSVKTDYGTPLNAYDINAIQKSILNIGPHIETIHQSAPDDYTKSLPKPPVMQPILQPILHPVVQPPKQHQAVVHQHTMSVDQPPYEPSPKLQTEYATEYKIESENYANEQDSGLFKPLLDQSRRGKGRPPYIPYKNNDPLNLNVIHLIAHQKHLPLIVPVSSIISTSEVKNEYQPNKVPAAPESSYSGEAGAQYEIQGQKMQDAHGEPVIVQHLTPIVTSGNPVYPAGGPAGAGYEEEIIYEGGKKKRKCNKQKQLDNSIYSQPAPVAPIITSYSPEVPPPDQLQIQDIKQDIKQGDPKQPKYMQITEPMMNKQVTYDVKYNNNEPIVQEPITQEKTTDYGSLPPAPAPIPVQHVQVQSPDYQPQQKFEQQSEQQYGMRTPPADYGYNQVIINSQQKASYQQSEQQQQPDYQQQQQQQAYQQQQPAYQPQEYQQPPSYPAPETPAAHYSEQPALASFLSNLPANVHLLSTNDSAGEYGVGQKSSVYSGSSGQGGQIDLYVTAPPVQVGNNIEYIPHQDQISSKAEQPASKSNYEQYSASSSSSDGQTYSVSTGSSPSFETEASNKGSQANTDQKGSEEQQKYVQPREEEYGARAINKFNYRNEAYQRPLPVEGYDSPIIQSGHHLVPTVVESPSQKVQLTNPAISHHHEIMTSVQSQVSEQAKPSAGSFGKRLPTDKSSDDTLISSASNDPAASLSASTQTSKATSNSNPSIIIRRRPSSSSSLSSSSSGSSNKSEDASTIVQARSIVSRRRSLRRGSGVRSAQSGIGFRVVSSEQKDDLQAVGSSPKSSSSADSPSKETIAKNNSPPQSDLSPQLSQQQHQQTSADQQQQQSSSNQSVTTTQSNIIRNTESTTVNPEATTSSSSSSSLSPSSSFSSVNEQSSAIHLSIPSAEATS